MRTLLILVLLFPQWFNPAIPLVWGTSQDAGTKSPKPEEKKEVINPLTDEERALNPRDILLNQPDFTADLGFFVNEGFGGYSGSEHVVRKGDRFREESQFWTFVGEIGKTTVRLYPQARLYDEMVPLRLDASDGTLLYPKAYALKSTATLTALGTAEIDGHRCLKLELLQQDKTEKIYLFAALDLKNLVIVDQSLGQKVRTVQKLTNVSLDAPEALVEVPADFKPIEHVRWTKVESAQVIYKNQPSKDFGVFRAPTGEMFIWIKDAYYPWEYLYRPQSKTVEIVFQGLLVNRSGTYIWKTRETEAFSSINFSGASRTTMDSHLVEIPNGIKFRSNNYKQDLAMIEITWQ
jgi:hypothetical protein